MTGFLFPKQKTAKKRKTHKPSILHQKDGTCYLCIRLRGDYRIHPMLHEHHVYGGTANRRVSEAAGMKVYLCPDHHEFGAEAVHNNYEYMRLIQRDCQRAYEQTHTREAFMALIGRSYL